MNYVMFYTVVPAYATSLDQGFESLKGGTRLAIQYNINMFNTSRDIS